MTLPTSVECAVHPVQTFPDSRADNKTWSAMRPLDKVETDFSHWNSQDYLLVSDYVSKFPFEIPMNSLSFRITVIQLNQILSINGVPREVFMDNWPPLTIKITPAFTCQWRFTHSTSCSLYPQSDGFIEQYIQALPDASLRFKWARYPCTRHYSNWATLHWP